MNGDPSLETANLILAVVSCISILGLIAMILFCFLRHFSACVKANLAKARAEIAAERAARNATKEALAAQQAALETARQQAILKKFDQGIREIFPLPPPRLLLSHFKVQQFLREKTNRN